jgi:hypothetical protein
MAHKIKAQALKSPLPPPVANPIWNTVPTVEDDTCCCPGALCLCNIPNARR